VNDTVKDKSRVKCVSNTRSGENRGFCLSGFFAFLILFAVSACQPFPRFRVELLPQYDAMFQDPFGWTGADGAYSSALGDHKFLWAFGDTLIGEAKGGRRVMAGMVPNSIAIQVGKEPSSASVDFFPDGGTIPFWNPEEGAGWFWPFHALRTPDGLYLFLLQLERADVPPPFGFGPVSSWLMRVHNPEDPPTRWIFSRFRIPWGNAQRQFGSFVLMEGDYGYIYGTVAEPTKEGIRRHMILARAPLERFTDFPSWLFYRDGGWVSDADRAGRICENAASEFSVSFQPALNQYVLVYTEKGFPRTSNAVVIRLSPALHGPWSDPIPVYQCPEARRDPGICCYAAKGHPELSLSPDELILTYVANSCAGDLEVLSDASLYRPRFLRILFADPRKR